MLLASSSPSTGLYPRPSTREGCKYMYFIYLFFCYPFWLIFFSRIGTIHQRRRADLQRASFCFSYQLELPGILLKYLSVIFLIIPSAPTITGSVVVLKCHAFSFSISRSSYLFILLYSLTDMLLFVGTYISIRRHVFLLESLIKISGRLLFIFLSIWIAKSKRKIASLVSVMSSDWCFFSFSNFSIPYFLHISFEHNVQFHLVFLYILLMYLKKKIMLPL